MKIRGWGLTDVGRKRDHNEDSFLCDDDAGLYLVADGMGGHLGGERASRMAVDIVARHIGKTLAAGMAPAIATETTGQAETATAEQTLKAAVHEADRTIYDSALADPAVAGMGTTLTALFFHEGRALVGHVGDSRAYLYRDGRIRQLTEDHSWIQEQVRAGLLSAEEAKESRFRNIITRSVGFEPLVNPDMHDVMVQAGDCFVLCSDGLSNFLSTEDIGQVLTTRFYSDAPAALIEMANDRGGDDNITCICVYASNDAV